jgi:adenosylcobinamide-GDP ribazoletransferase
MPASSGRAGAVLLGAAGAVSFLTRMPLTARVSPGAADVARGAALFPVVGAGIGALVGLVAGGLDGRLTLFLAAALAVALEAGMTGAIHLDALADSADGLGARGREGALALMREPIIGAFGATALVLDVLVKTAAVAAIAQEPRPVLVAAAAFATGRAAPLALAWALPYAGTTGGTGLALAGHACSLALATGLGLGLLLPLVFVWPEGLVLVGAAAAATALVGVVASRRLGGVTGDVLGAALELGTTFALVAAAALR